MKKIITLIALSLLITSCSKSEDPIPKVTETEIAGTWYLTSSFEDGNSDLNDCNKKSTLTITKDLNAKLVSFGEDDKGDCKQEGSKITLTQKSSIAQVTEYDTSEANIKLTLTAVTGTVATIIIKFVDAPKDFQTWTKKK